MAILRLTVLAAAAALGCAGSAQAATLLDSSMYASLQGNNNVNIGGVLFTAAGGDGVFSIASAGGSSGIGVAGGGAGDEIGLDESISISFASQVISDFSVSLLYNGPEFGDYREIAQVSVFDGATLLQTYTLQVGNDGDVPGATWSGGGSVTNLSLPTEGGGGSWLVLGNPFGNQAVTRVEFSALASASCQSQSCTNQSDYAVSSLNSIAAPIPEPETYALMLAGLGLVAMSARGRRARR